MVDDAQNARSHIVDGWCVVSKRAVLRQVRIRCFIRHRLHETFMV
jgi:hypothetical protein